MSFAAAKTAIRARFATGWGATTPIAWENIDFDPDTQAVDGAGKFIPWVYFEVIFGDAQQVSMGQANNQFRATGLVQIHVFVPKGAGEDGAIALCDQAAAIFRASLADPKLRFLAPYPQTGGASGAFWRQTVSCPFTFDDNF